MIILKFIILTIAIVCSLYLLWWATIGVTQAIIAAKYNKSCKISIGFLWFILVALSWSAYFVFF